MATIGRSNNASTQSAPRRSYISTYPFPGYFFSYKVQPGVIPTFALGPVDGADTTTCPSGRVLRENGRKLYPGANGGVNTYLVGVYDTITLLSGFIDPNARVFAVYNSDKPNFLQNDSSSNIVDQAGMLGSPVLTTGSIISVGSNHDNFIVLTDNIDKAYSKYSALYEFGGAFVTESGNDYTSTYATLYENGSITSINAGTSNIVALTSDGNIFNTGSISTISSITAGNCIYSSSGIGYNNGDTQTQQTNKTTSVTLHKPTGLIVTSTSGMISNAVATFTLYNSYIGLNDILVVVCINDPSFHYLVGVGPCLAGSCQINMKNISDGVLSDALQLQFAIIKSAVVEI